MKNKTNKCLILGAALMFLLSIPLHFLFDMIGRSPFWVGFFVPVSESVWEHLKLLFYPGLITGVAEYFCFGKKYSNFLLAKTLGVFCGMAGIVTSFYTYSGILGRNFLVADILTYIVGVLVCQAVTASVIKNGRGCTTENKKISVLVLILMALLFAVYTYNPPMLNIFISPQ